MLGTSPALTDPAPNGVRRIGICPGRPNSIHVDGIEPQDYSEKTGLLCRASLALDEHVSMQSSATSLEHGER